VLGPVDRLSDKTICMATKFGENGEYLHYNVHNLYGQTQAIATQRHYVKNNFCNVLLILNLFIYF